MITSTNELIQDVCPLEFPPENYGQTIEEIEATIQTVVEHVFRDGDDILLSSVSALTMKPLRPEDVKDRPDGVGTFAENSDIPRKARALWMNYENTGQASGVYLDALCAKALATGDPEIPKLARRLFDAIVLLWENGAQAPHPLGGAGRGWFPKPYLGIRDVSKMYECSADQYVDIALGLHSYYQTLASETEKHQIEEIIVSFADWWYDHDYAGIYFGRAIWWKRLVNHSLAVSTFLYLNALAYSWKPCQKFQHGFETWLELKDSLFPPGEPDWVCMNGITLKCMERLIDLRPDLADIWQRAATHQAQILVKTVENPKGFNRAYEINGFAANYLSTAHRLMPDEGYDRYVRTCLEACTTRSSFYHIARGEPLANLSSRETGSDMLHGFQCECHVHWFAGYWGSISTVNKASL